MLKFGWSKKVISIDGPIGITGQFHERISKGVYDENLLTALVVDDGSTVSVFLSADLVSVSHHIIFEIREAVAKKNPAIPTQHILMNATHTHTSPRYFKFGSAGYDKAPHDKVEYMMPEEYRGFLVAQASDAVCEAYESRAEGSFAYGYGYAVVAQHRRPTYFDDLRLRGGSQGPTSLKVDKHAKMYGNTNDPQFAGYEGNVDSTAYFMFTFDRNDRLTGAIVNVPCPSQNSEHEELLTGDYWVEFRKFVKEKYGDIFILAQCAAAGDMAPRTLHGRSAENRKYALKYEGMTFPKIQRSREMFNRMEIAQRILAAFDDTYAWAKKDKIREAKLTHMVENMKLDAWKITKEQYESAKEEYEKYKNVSWVETENPMEDFVTNTKHSTVLARYETIMDRYETDRDYYEPEIHVIALGDIAFASNPYELYVNYQHRIQARSPFVQTFIIQLAAATDGNGYLCTAPAAENMGYSANIYSCSVSPEGGNTLVEKTLETLDQIKANAQA